MKFSLSTASVTLLTCLSFLPFVAQAQEDMKDMPGMVPKATTEPKKPAPEPAADAKPQEEMDAMPGMAPKKKPAPTAGAMSQEEMDAMPGMKPAKPATKNDMKGMPGMGDESSPKGKAMEAMPGMASGKKSTTKGMESMPGMPGMESNGTAPPPRMSAPGITILRPPQKWVPPPGGDRSDELLPLDELNEFQRALPPPIEDSMLHGMLLAEIFEYRANSSAVDTFSWDLVGWYGGDTNRLWVKSEGSLDLDSAHEGTGDLQILYGRMIAPFWDLQAGIRAKSNLGSGFDGNTRTYAVIGLQGLAPGNFEIEPAIYISDRGEVSAELTASYDLYLTQRLILQPRFQGEVSLSGDDRFGTGEGVTETDIGVRLRYEISREFAPYIGVSWLNTHGETARLGRRSGESSGTVAFVAGIRFWW